MMHLYYSTIIIVVLTYIALACDNVPFIKVDRPSIALIGAAAILVFTPYSLTHAAADINFPLLCLLFGMMVVVAYLEISGFFTVAMHWISLRCKSPQSLLALTVFISGFLSAFLINDVICFALTPLVIQMCRQRQLPMLPYLLALGTAANIGSVATLTGNPQNMLIGSFCHISYLQFSLHTAPIAVCCLLVDYIMLGYCFRRSLKTVSSETVAPMHHKIERPFFLIKCVVITLAVIACFFTHIPLGITAIAAAAVLLIDNTSPKKVYRLIDWPLLILFINLFILIGALEQYVMPHWHIGQWSLLQHSPRIFISASTIVLSNLVSNVPAVLLLKPIILHTTHPQSMGISVAVMSTLAGNLTIIGSLANLIVVTVARKHGVTLSFWQFLRFGLPITIITLIIGYSLLLV